MKDLISKTWRMVALRGVIAILFGLFAVSRPGATLLAFTWLFAAFALGNGLVLLIEAVQERHGNEDWWIALIMGIVSVGAGVIALIHPALTALILVLLVGANALVGGALDIGAAIRWRKLMKHQWLLALSGVVAIAFGVLVFMYPVRGGLAIALYVGIYALITGALQLAFALSMRSTGKMFSAGRTDRRITPDRRMAAHPA